MLRKSPRLAEWDADAAEDFADDPTAARRSIVYKIYRCPQHFAAGIAQAGGFSGLIFLRPNQCRLPPRGDSAGQDTARCFYPPRR